MTARQKELSHHILPASGTMIGVCATLIGLVKVAENQFGPSPVDEYVSLVLVIFVISAIASYVSIRFEGRARLSSRFETVADIFFLVGLLGIAAVAVLYAYEAI